MYAPHSNTQALCSYGAVGTPILFGLDGLNLSDADLREVGFRASIILGVCAHVVPIYAASFVVPFADLRRSWLFVLLSIWSAIVPAIALSLVSTDFSSLVGGMVATVTVGVLTKYKVCNVLVLVCVIVVCVTEEEAPCVFSVFLCTMSTVLACIQPQCPDGHCTRPL